MDGGRLLYRALDRVLPAGTEIKAWEVDGVYQQIVMETYAQGDRFLQLLLYADVLDAAREPEGPQRRPRINGTAVIEGVFEAERRRIAPDKPSRIGSVHTFRDLESARLFAHEHPNRPHLHEVRIAAGSAFDTDMDWVTRGFELRLAFSDQIEAMRDRALRYWRGEHFSPHRFAETIVAGRVVVARHVETVAVGVMEAGTPTG